MPDLNDYIKLINEIIEKQTVVLGSDIVLMKAKNVAGLKLDASGKVVDIEGDPQAVLQTLIDQYIALTGQIVKNILTPVFSKYPEIKIAMQ